MDLINRQDAIEAIEHRLAESAYQHTGEDWYVGMSCAESEIYELPSAEPEIIYCKDCKRHNVGIGDYREENEKRHWYWKDEACPLVGYRGKAQGHEFDYQYCAFGKRKEEKQ